MKAKKVVLVSISILVIICVLCGIAKSFFYSTPIEASEVVEEKVKVLLGIDVLKEENFRQIQGKKVGLLTNKSAVDGIGRETWRIFQDSPFVDLRAIFAPVHGLNVNYLALETFFNDEIDGIPVYSMYANNTRPKDEWLNDLDVIVIDLQGVGMRYYNYWGFMVYMMVACFERDIEVIVLDRPNPLGGIYVGGPVIEDEFTSVWGPISKMPLFHGMTIGELALYCKSLSDGISSKQQIETGIIYSDIIASYELLSHGKLSVIPMQGWRRSMIWDETGLDWVRTSPLIANWQSVVDYAASSLMMFLSSSYGFENSNFISFKPIFHKQLPFHCFISKYVTYYDIINFTKKHIPAIESILIESKYESRTAVTMVMEFGMTDLNDIPPASLGLCMLALSQKYTMFNVFDDDNLSMIQTHIGDSELVDCLVHKKSIDVAYFMKKWSRLADEFIQATRPYYLYDE